MPTGDILELPRDQNQALGLARYAIGCLREAQLQPAPEVLERVELFHLDSVACAAAALGCRTNAPVILRQEALGYPSPAPGPTCFGSSTSVKPEKAVVANCAAVRELDANGTNFGYNPAAGEPGQYTKGEFGHNDFYPVVVAAAQQTGCDGARTLAAMLCLDEIRGRLAEAFSLKDHKIDHVLHGAIASAAVYGALCGADERQIESALGLVVAHYVPFRAIRAGHQLSDSKGASAAISAEVAVLSVLRAMRGFVGPRDVFRNPQAVFCLFEPPDDPMPGACSPFDLRLALRGHDFAIMGMHFKLGLYEHQSAGAIQGLIDVLQVNPQARENLDDLRAVRITTYEPAFSIIGDPAKRNPTTRQSADHSMVYIVASILRKAFESGATDWEDLMLLPSDYDQAALDSRLTRQVMDRIEFVHGGAAYDEKYPDGIPTSVEIDHARLGKLDSGLVMYPLGHARNHSSDFPKVLSRKIDRLLALGTDSPAEVRQRLEHLSQKSPREIRELYSFPLVDLD